MLSEDKCYELWHQKGEIVDMIRHIYTMGYNDAIKLKKVLNVANKQSNKNRKKPLPNPFKAREKYE